MTVNIFHHGFTFVLTSPSVLSYFRTHHWIGFSFDFCNASTLVYLSTPWLAAIRKSYICRGMKRPLQQLKWIHSSEPPFYWTEYNMQWAPIPLHWTEYNMRCACLPHTLTDKWQLHWSRFALAESWCLVNRQTGALAFKDICYTISVFRQIWLTVYGSGNAIMVQLFKRFKALPAMASDRQLMLIAKVDIAQKVKVRSNVGLPRKYISFLF